MVIDAKRFLEGLFRSDDQVAVSLAPPAPVDWARAAAALLADVDDDELRAGWRYQFEERSAVYEFDAGLPRDEAERLALEYLRQLMRE